jgi:hypothetical protein
MKYSFIWCLYNFIVVDSFLLNIRLGWPLEKYNAYSLKRDSNIRIDRTYRAWTCVHTVHGSTRQGTCKAANLNTPACTFSAARRATSRPIVRQGEGLSCSSRWVGVDTKLEARGSARARQGLARARLDSKGTQAKPKPSDQSSRLDKPARWSLQAGSKGSMQNNNLELSLLYI